MTSFIVASAFEKAEAVIESYQRIELSEKAFARAHELSRESAENPKAHKNLVQLLRKKNERARSSVRPGESE